MSTFYLTNFKVFELKFNKHFLSNTIIENICVIDKRKNGISCDKHVFLE